jgi:antitoxin component of RelBE/YafQ-DinJ toxin-antitoxin module
MTKDNEMISLWIANNEKQIIRDVAKNNHMSMSDVIRILISNNIKNLQKDSTLQLV